MAAPTGGHPYNGDQRVPGEHGDNRFGFPAAPGGQGPGQYQPYQQQEHQQQGASGGPGSEWPQQQPGAGWPQQPQQRHDTSQQPRIQPVQQRRAPEPAKPAAHNPLVRPYAMTGGRTRPRYQLAIEALVSTTADPARLQGQLPEHQRICRLCIEIKSVAEVSALLSIPLGVARILVADLAEAGLVAIHQPGGDEAAGGQPDVTLLERVLSGLRKL
ncbi:MULTISPECIES: DUF742 domain-containing protein [unclassified Streptomyces]|uniref:DUF742 domain-containing protein n=1 Tax=unclassified Streptomyces TaxID=2593676 RepID=UPI0024A95C30|nr:MULTISPECIES: DUF742 domain-containing protein [unclassified Streptomyces]